MSTQSIWHFIYVHRPLYWWEVLSLITFRALIMIIFLFFSLKRVRVCVWEWVYFFSLFDSHLRIIKTQISWLVYIYWHIKISLGEYIYTEWKWQQSHLIRSNKESYVLIILMYAGKRQWKRKNDHTLFLFFKLYNLSSSCRVNLIEMICDCEAEKKHMIFFRNTCEWEIIYNFFLFPLNRMNTDDFFFSIRLAILNTVQNTHTNK